MSEKIDKMVTQVEELTVMELSELVKAIEEKFDVSAAAPAMAMAAMRTGDIVISTQTGISTSGTGFLTDI